MILMKLKKYANLMIPSVLGYHPNEGDIILTPETAQRLIPFTTSQNENLSAAFTNKNETFWTENKVNGYYIIGYTINDKLDSLNKQTIPKVRNNLHMLYYIIYRRQ